MSERTDRNSVQRLAALADAWQEHCADKLAAADETHRPVSIHGTATFDTNLARTYIACCVEGCDWEMTLVELQEGGARS